MPWSLPIRECGLKYLFKSPSLDRNAVTPYTGVWIEIGGNISDHLTTDVTPYTGVWIEMDDSSIHQGLDASLPIRECGLKSKYVMN